MADKYIKAHCAKHDKWFALELDSARGGLQVVNFVGMTKEEAQRIQTEVSGTSFRVAPTLRRCCKCGTDKVGTCSHTESLTAGGTSMCDVAYSYQCLFCDQLRISGAKADTSRYSEWVGISNIPGATKDRFGNPQGSQYDLAKDGGFKGSKIVFMCLNRAVIVQLDCAIEALKRNKGKGPNDVYYVFSVQEELGGRGAQTAAAQIAPDIGISVDVTPDHAYPGDLTGCNVVGAGVGVKLGDPSAIMDEYLVDEMLACCEENGIKYQRDVMDRGGTDASSMNLSGAGVRVAAISIVDRFPHSQSSIISKDDVRNAIKLTDHYTHRTFVFED